MSLAVSARAEELFLAATDLDAAEQDAFLRRECGSDGTLRKEVQSLLTASNRANDFFDTLARRFGLTSIFEGDLERLDDDVIGAYRLIRLLGRGGMGAVYLAERADEQFEKQVALKVLPFGVAGDEAERRFVAERQILAQLVHPNIARLLDGGITERGTPYFVMDYVPGKPIDKYCDEHALDVDARLALFCKVGEAVQYAHRNLVVHRDLKPANVLVEETGDVKLVDFGIAKALAPDAPGEQATRAGARPMTPLYASPEMLRNEQITTASDVYALGVLLFVLLTGRHPYRLRPEATDPEIWHQICEEAPALLSKAVLENDDEQGVTECRKRAARRNLTAKRLHQRLRGDLDTIIGKALRKSPDQRYGSVEQLLTDIRRHQTGLPVLAQPPTLAYRARKFVKRRKGLVAAGIAALLFIVTVVYQANQTAQEAERANREAHVARQVSNFLISIFEVADPGEARGREITAVELLDRGADQISEAVTEDPELRARLMATIGHVYNRLGVYPEAGKFLAESLETQRRLLGNEHPETLRSMNQLGDLYENQGRYAEARALFAEAVEIQRRVLGADHSDTLDSLNDLAIAHAQQGDWTGAAELLEEVVAARRREYGLEHAKTLGPINNLAVMYQVQGLMDRAESLYLEMLEPQRKVFGDDHPRTMGLLQNLADTYTVQGRYSEAQALYVDALARARLLLGNEHPDTARVAVNLAEMYRSTGNLDAARSLYVEMLPVQREVLGSDHPDTLITVHRLGRLYGEQEQYAQAEELLHEALEGNRQALGDGHGKTLDSLSSLIDVYTAAGKTDEALPLTNELLSRRRALAERDNATPEDKNAFAWALLTCEPNDLRDPVTALGFALDANEQSGHTDPRHLRTLALAHYLTGDHERAVETQQQAIEHLPGGASSLRKDYRSTLAEFEAELRQE